MTDQQERYGIYSQYAFEAKESSFATMNRVVVGMKAIEQSVLQAEAALKRSGIAQAFNAIGVQAEVGIGSVAQQVRQVATSSKTVTQTLKPLKDEFRALRAEARNIDFGDLHDEQQFKSATQQVHQYVDALKSLETQVSRDTTLEREFAAELKRRQSIAQTQLDLVEQQRKAAVASERLGASQTLQVVGQSLLTPLAGAGKDAIKILADFNDQMSQVQAVSGATARDIGILRQKAEDLGATTRFSASEAAEGLIFLSQAGYSAQDQLKAIDGTLNLASAGALGLAEATDITVSTLGGFQLGAGSAAHAADVLAYAANAANTDVGQIGEAMKYAAPAAKAFGATMEQTSAMIGLLSNAGIKGSQAGTALRSGFLRLASPPKMAAAAISELKLQVSDAEGTIRPINDILGDLQGRLSGVAQDRKIKLIKDLFGTEASSSFLYLVDNVGKLNDMTGAAYRSSEGLGAATQAARIMEDNLGGSFRNFESALEGFKIAFIETLEPLLRFVVDLGSNIINFFTGLPAPIRVVISVGLGLITVVATLATVLGTAGVAFYGLQSAMATAQVGMLSMQRSAIPLTGFFETSMAAFQTGGIVRVAQQLIASAEALPGPLGQATIALRSFGASALAFMVSPLGLTIASLFILIKLLQRATPGIDLLGATIDLLGAPFMVLNKFLQGIRVGFEQAFGKSFQDLFSPIFTTFTTTFNEAYDAFEKLADAVEKIGEAIGSKLARLFVPMLQGQAMVAKTIVAIWAGTIGAVTKQIERWVQLAQALGVLLVGALAENSPGPTFQIRQRWRHTTESIGGYLSGLLAVASEVGTTLQNIFFFVLEGIAEGFRTGLAAQVAKALIQIPGIVGARARNRFTAMLAAIMASPQEAETPQYELFSSLSDVIWRTREQLTLLIPAMKTLGLSVPGGIFEGAAKAILRFGLFLNRIENFIFSNFDRITKFSFMLARLAKTLERMPFLSAGIRQVLTSLGRFAGVVGILLSMRDSLSIINFLLIGLKGRLDAANIPSGWLGAVIDSIKVVINQIGVAEWWLISLLRSFLWLDRTTLNIRLAEAAILIRLAWQSTTTAITALLNGLVTIATMTGNALVGALNHSAADITALAWTDASDWIIKQWERLAKVAGWLGNRILDAIADPIGFLEFYVLTPIVRIMKQVGQLFVKGAVLAIQNAITAIARNLNALGGISLGVSLVGLFFAPAGIARIVASTLPALISALIATGVFGWLENQLSHAFEWAVDQAFGEAEPKWVQRVRDVGQTLNRIFQAIGQSIVFTVQNPIAALGEAAIIVRPLLGAFRELADEIDAAGGVTQAIGKALGFMIRQFNSVRTAAGQVVEALSGLGTQIIPFLQSAVAGMGDLGKTLLTVLSKIPGLRGGFEQLVSIATKLADSPVGKLAGGQLGTIVAVSMAAGKTAQAVGRKGTEVADASIKLIGSEMEQVIQLLLWIGRGVYGMYQPGVQAFQKVPFILKAVQGASGNLLSFLGIFDPFSILAKLLGRNSKTERITALDILSPILPDILVPPEQRVLGPKVGTILEQKQPGFAERDPFTKREIIGSITKQLKPTGIPLISSFSPIFTPALIANVELFGGAILSLTAILGGLGAALYVFKPEIAKPVFKFFQGTASTVWGLAFVLLHLSRVVVPETANVLQELMLKVGVPKWAIQSTIILTQLANTLVKVVTLVVKTIDFVLGVIPTLVRSSVALVLAGYLGLVKVVLGLDQAIIRAVRNTLKSITDAFVLGFATGDWSALGGIALRIGKAIGMALGSAVLATVAAIMIGLAPATMAVLGGVAATLYGVVEAYRHNVFRIATLTETALGAIGNFLQAQFQRFTTWLNTLIHHPIRALFELLDTVKWVVGAIVVALATPVLVRALASIATTAITFFLGLSPVIKLVAASVVGAVAAILTTPGTVIQAFNTVVEAATHPIATLDQLIATLQHPIDHLSQAITMLLRIATTPINPTDWFFAPLSGFFSEIGKWIKQWFPLLFAGLLAFNVAMKGPVAGVIDTFGLFIGKIIDAVKAVFSLVGAVTTLGKKTRDYRDSFEGGIRVEQASRLGNKALRRISGGALGRSREPLDIQAERDAQFQQKKAVLQFRKEVAKLQRQQEVEFAKAMVKTSGLLRESLVERGYVAARENKVYRNPLKAFAKELVGQSTLEQTTLSKPGQLYARETIGAELKEGKRAFSDEALGAIAKKVGLDLSTLPIATSLQDLARDKATVEKGREFVEVSATEELLKQLNSTIDQMVQPLTQAATSMEQAATSMKQVANTIAPQNVVSINRQKISDRKTIDTIRIGETEIKAMAATEAGKFLRQGFASSPGSPAQPILTLQAQQIIKDLQGVAGTKGISPAVGKIPSEIIMRLAAELGVKNRPVLDDLPGDFKPSDFTKQGVQNSSKQLQVLQILEKLGQVKMPAGLSEGMMSLDQIVNAVHRASVDFQRAEGIGMTDAARGQAVMDEAADQFKQQLKFLQQDDLDEIVQQLARGFDSKNIKLQVINKLLSEQIKLILGEGVNFTPLADAVKVEIQQIEAEATQAANQVQTAVAQASRSIQSPPRSLWGRLKQSIVSFTGSIGSGFIKISNDLADNIGVIQRIRDRRKDAQQLQLVQQRQAKFANLQRQAGISDQSALLAQTGIQQSKPQRMIGQLMKATLSATAQNQAAVDRTQERTPLVQEIIGLVSTNTTDVALKKITPKVKAELQRVADNRNQSLQDFVVELQRLGRQEKGGNLITEKLSELGIDKGFRKGVEKFRRDIVDRYRVAINGISMGVLDDASLIEGLSKEDRTIVGQVTGYLKKFAKANNTSLQDLLYELREKSDREVFDTLLRAGAITELSSEKAIQDFLRQSGVKLGEIEFPPDPKLTTALRVLQGDFGDLRTEVIRKLQLEGREVLDPQTVSAVLGQLSKALGVGVEELIDPGLTKGMLQELKNLRSVKAKQLAGVKSFPDLKKKLDVSLTDLNNLITGRFSEVQAESIEKIVKQLGFQSRQDLEAAFSSTALLAEQRKPVQVAKTALQKAIGTIDIFGLGQVLDSFDYGETLRKQVNQIETAEQQAATQLQRQQQQAAMTRTQGLERSLLQVGKSRRQFDVSLTDLNTADPTANYVATFERFMQTGEWKNVASSEQIGEIRKIFGNAKPAQFEQLRKSLNKNNLTSFLAEYIKTGVWADDATADIKAQINKILKSTVGIKPENLATVLTELSDNELDKFLAEYLKTGTFAQKFTEKQKANIAVLAGLTIPELEGLESAIDQGSVGAVLSRSALSIQMFVKNLGNQYQDTIRSIRASLIDIPFIGNTLVPIFDRLAESIAESFASIRNQFNRLNQTIQNVPIIKQVRAARRQQEQDQSKSLQRFVREAGYQKMGDFVAAFTSTLSEKTLDGKPVTPEQVKAELLKVLKPSQKGIGSGDDRVLKPTIEALQEVLQLSDAQMQALTQPGGYTVQAIKPLSFYIAKRLPLIVSETTTVFLNLAAQLTGQTAKTATAIGIRTLAPFLARPLATFSREVGHRVADIVNTLRTAMPANRWLMRLEDSIRERGIKVGRFFDKEADAIDARRLSSPSLVQRFQTIVTAIGSTYNEVLNQLAAVTYRAKHNALSRLSQLGSWAKGIFGSIVQSVRTFLAPVGREIERGMMGRMRRQDSLQEVKIQKQSFEGSGNIRSRTHTGAFVPDDAALSTSYQRGLARFAGTPRKPKPPMADAVALLPAKAASLKRSSLTQALDTISAGFQWGADQLPDARAQMVRSQRKSVIQVDPTGKAKVTQPLGERDFVGEEVLTLPARLKAITQVIANYFRGAATRSRTAWDESDRAIQSGWFRLVRRAIWTGSNIVLNMNHSAADTTAEAWRRADTVVEGEMTQMAVKAAQTGEQIAHSMTGATQRSIGMLGHLRSAVGSVNKAGMAVGGALMATSFAAQTIAFSLSNLGIVDEKTGQAISKFTELLSIVTAVGGLVAPLVGVVTGLGGAILSIGGLIVTTLFSPIGLAVAGVIGAIVAVNWAINHFLGVNLLASGFQALANLLKQPFEDAVNWIQLKWNELTGKFGFILNPLIKVAGDTGHQLIGMLSENSPGPTFQIRENWQKAVDFVAGAIQDIAPVAQQEGEKINQALRPQEKQQGWRFWGQNKTREVESVDGGALSIVPGQPVQPKKAWEFWKPDAPAIQAFQDIGDTLAKALSYAETKQQRQTIENLQKSSFRAPIGQNVMVDQDYAALQQDPAVGLLLAQADRVNQMNSAAHAQYGNLQTKQIGDRSYRFGQAGYAEFGDARRETIGKAQVEIERLNKAITALQKNDHAAQYLKANFGDQKINREEAIRKLQDRQFVSRYQMGQDLGGFRLTDQQRGFAQTLGYDPDGVEQASNRVLGIAQEFNDQWKDRMDALHRGATLADLTDDDRSQIQASLGVIQEDGAKFAGKFWESLKRLDFDGMGQAAMDFGNTFLFAATNIMGGFGGMIQSAIAFGVFSLASLSPVTIALGVMAVAILAIGVNFLGLRTIATGVLHIIKGSIQIIYGLVKGIGQILQGIGLFLRGLFAGDFQKMTDGIKLAFTGIQTIVTNFSQGLRTSLGGAVQIVQGIFQGLRQTIVAIFRTLGLSVESARSTFQRLNNGVRVLGNLLITVLLRPQEAWENFIGLLDRVRSKVQQVAKAAMAAPGNLLDRLTGRGKTKTVPVVDTPVTVATNLPDPARSSSRITGSLFPKSEQGNVGLNPHPDPSEAIRNQRHQALNDANDAVFALSGILATIAPQLAAPLMAISSLADGFITLTSVLPGVQGALSFLPTAFSAIGMAAKVAWGFMTGPLMPIVLGITAVVAVIALLWQSFKDLNAAKWIVLTAFQGALGKISQALHHLSVAIANAFAPLLSLFGVSGGQGIGTVMEQAFMLVIHPLIAVAKLIGIIMGLVADLIVHVVDIATVVTRIVLAPVTWILEKIVAIVSVFQNVVASVMRLGEILMAVLIPTLFVLGSPIGILSLIGSFSLMTTTVTGLATTLGGLIAQQGIVGVMNGVLSASYAWLSTALQTVGLSLTKLFAPLLANQMVGGALATTNGWLSASFTWVATTAQSGAMMLAGFIARSFTAAISSGWLTQANAALIASYQGLTWATFRAGTAQLWTTLQQKASTVWTWLTVTANRILSLSYQDLAIATLRATAVQLWATAKQKTVLAWNALVALSNTVLAGTFWTTASAAISAWTAMLAPLLPIIVAIGAVVAVVTLLYLAFQNNFLGIGTVIQTVWRLIQGLFGVLVSVVAVPFQILGGVLSGLFEIGQGVFQSFIGILDSVGSALETVWSAIQPMFDTFSQLGQTIATAFSPLLGGGNFDVLGGFVKSIAGALLVPFRILAAILVSIFKVIGMIVQVMAVGLVPIIRLIVLPVQILAGLLRGVINLIASTVNGIAGVIKSAINLVTGFFQFLYNLIPAPIRWVIENASNMMAGTANASATHSPSPAVQRFAAGGIVRGSGTSVGDRIPSLLSAGEFIVNATATRQNMGFLHAINAGMPAEAALQLLPVTPPLITLPPDGGAQPQAAHHITVHVSLNFGNIVVQGENGAEAGYAVMQTVAPEVERLVRETLRDMVERIR